MKKIKMTKWLVIRIAIYFLSFIIAFLETMNSKENKIVLGTSVLLYLFTFMFTAIGLPLLVKIQSSAPYLKKKWVVPTFRTNFFALGDPLHFFHAISFAVISVGLGTCVASFVLQRESLMSGYMVASFGIGLWVGTKISVRVCIKKYMAENGVNENG